MQSYILTVSAEFDPTQFSYFLYPLSVSCTVRSPSFETNNAVLLSSVRAYQKSTEAKALLITLSVGSFRYGSMA